MGIAKYQLKFNIGEKTVYILSSDLEDMVDQAEATEYSGITFDLVCPLCGDEMEHNYDEDDGAGNSGATNTCPNCQTAVTYVAPSKYGEYHEVPDSEAEFIIDLTDTHLPEEDEDDTPLEVVDKRE